MYVYETETVWKAQKEGIVRADSNPEIQVATPQEFGGPDKGFWSPEQLFVSSVATCLMSTFLFFVEKQAIRLQGYTSHVRGQMDKTPAGLQFTEIQVTIDIHVESEQDLGKVERLKDKIEQYCPVSASLKCPVELAIDVKAIA